MSPLLQAAGNASLGLPAQLLRLLLLMLLYVWRLIRFLLGVLKGDPFQPRRPHRTCPDEVPPQVRRKPDPCLYSQSYLMSQGLPVTWDNPDIVLTELDGTPVPSGQLEADHPYVVNARISNASSYPALGVEVRCAFRDWGLAGPWLPVELTPGGIERVVGLHIARWASANAAFRWRTPPTAGHFCLRVSCHHPDDKNPANNVGQENTQVIEGAPGATVGARMLVENPAPLPSRLAVAADTYRIPRQEWEFRRITVTRELGGDAVRVEDEPGEPIPLSMGRRLGRWVVHPDATVPRVTRQFYEGRDRLYEAQRRARTPVPAGWEISLDAEPAQAGIVLGPEERREVELRIRIPPEAAPGTELAINVAATDAVRGGLNGVTVILRVT